MKALTVDTLPDDVLQLPDDAQGIWLSIYNSALQTWSGSEDEKVQAANSAAWVTIQSRFQIGDDAKTWSPRKEIDYDADRLDGKGVWGCKFVANATDARHRVTFGEVYVPWEFDAQGDFAAPDTIEHAAHTFMKHFREIGEQHMLFGGKGVPVESFLARPDDGMFSAGSWILGTQWSEDMWNQVQNGSVNGYSLGGKWKRIPVVAGPELVKRVSGGKSAIDASVLEAPTYDGPRLLSEIVELIVQEVSGVDVPANRKRWAYFKRGGAMSDKGKARTRVVGNKEEHDITAPAGDAAAAGAAGTPLAFDACVVSVDSMLGAGNGSPVCHLMSAKWGNPAAANDPEAPAILIPQDLTMEQAVEECVEVGTSAGLFEVKKVDGKESTLPIFGKLLAGMKAIAQHVGVKLDGDNEEGKDEPMTTEERKQLDGLKESVATLEKSVGGIGDTITEAIAKALGKDTDGDKGKDKDKEKDKGKAAAAAAADGDKGKGKEKEEKSGAADEKPDEEDTDAYPAWALELRDAIVGIGKRLDDVETKGLSDQTFDIDGDAGTKSGGDDENRMVRSGLLGIPISAADAKAQKERHDARRKKRAERRAETGPVRMRGGAGG